MAGMEPSHNESGSRYQPLPVGASDGKVAVCIVFTGESGETGIVDAAIAGHIRTELFPPGA
jgi:hypothetical protein